MDDIEIGKSIEPNLHTSMFWIQKVNFPSYQLWLNCGCSILKDLFWMMGISKIPIHEFKVDF